MPNVVVKTKKITREKLAKFFPDNHELVRFLESLVQDVVVNIPDAINPDAQTLEDTVEAVGVVQALAQAVQAQALQALASITEGDLLAQLATLRERLTVAERAIANLKEGPTP